MATGTTGGKDRSADALTAQRAEIRAKIEERWRRIWEDDWLDDEEEGAATDPVTMWESEAAALSARSRHGSR